MLERYLAYLKHFLKIIYEGNPIPLQAVSRFSEPYFESSDKYLTINENL